MDQNLILLLGKWRIKAENDFKTLECSTSFISPIIL